MGKAKLIKGEMTSQVKARWGFYHGKTLVLLMKADCFDLEPRAVEGEL